MTQPFIGEIRTTAYTFAPAGWATCDGQLLPISSNTALFSILGTYYGGDGRSTFALPDLRGRCALNQGQGPGLTAFSIGESGGVASVTLRTQEMASHPHAFGVVDAAGTASTPAANALGESRIGRDAQLQYGTGVTPALMNPQLLNMAGSNLPHNNMPPYLVINFIIALQGIFPSRS